MGSRQASPRPLALSTGVSAMALDLGEDAAKHDVRCASPYRASQSLGKLRVTKASSQAGVTLPALSGVKTMEGFAGARLHKKSPADSLAWDMLPPRPSMDWGSSRAIF